MARTIELDAFLNADDVATTIANYWQSWDNLRAKWVADKKEIQEYIFATSTSGTSNASLPWKNRIHIPKLCQIRDNLHANYMATIHPNDEAIIWEGDDTDSETREKRLAIQNYMTNKLKQSGFWDEVEKLILDYIDYGNVFAMPVFEASYIQTEEGEQIPKYIGPRLTRINPTDIAFDPTAPSFESAPKIIRSVKTMGSLKADILDHPELGYQAEAFDRMMENRHAFANHSQGDFKRNELYDVNGFTGFWHYFNSDYVEILDFYGDFFDRETGELKKNHLISVVDRSVVIRDEQNDNWLGAPPIRHTGWRVRQDNLYAMGPLDNLIGLQHRIDHLENAKADAFDMILHPVLKVTGYVEDFEYGPGERIYAGEEGDVQFMAPDVTFLSADTQIQMYEEKMEQMAGAPKQAVGFRTPGEKTKYEVQVLENGANRVFINKISHFESTFLEPLMNDMLEMARRNLDEYDEIRVIDEETQAVMFQKVTKEDITARGKIRPVGARHHAENAQIVQNLTQFSQTPISQMPTVLAHFSGERLAHVMEHLLGLEKWKIVQKNIGLYEQAELANISGNLQQGVLEEQTAGMDPAAAAALTTQAMTGGQGNAPTQA
jgi:hypothetical protein